jgi:hypothetical protein
MQRNLDWDRQRIQEEMVHYPAIVGLAFVALT